MEQLTVGTGMKLCWVQPKAYERWYELRSGRQLFASLSGQAGCGAMALAQSAQSAWTLKQVGFHNRHVMVREVGTEANMAVYRPRWLGDGSVQFPDGRLYRWRSSGFTTGDWCFYDGSGNPLLSFRCRVELASLSAWSREQALVEVCPAGEGLAELPLLMLLGGYLLLFRQQEVRVGAGATVAVTAACAA